jgi:dienelactone hydrolase
MSRLIILFSFLVFFIATEVNAENKKLSAREAANDANGDGLLQKNETNFPTMWDWKANFDQIDCDKNSGLDRAEIVRFKNFKACPNQGDGAHIYHQKAYPTGSGPFPAVIALHTSGGAKGTRNLIENYRKETWLKSGYAWYAPNFFDRHGITTKSRMETFDDYREHIEKELAAIIALMKSDPKIDSKNIFAIGFSNGGFWTSFLAGKGIVTAGASHYGVWKANMGQDMTNPYPMEYFSSKSSPLLALHGEDDSTQKIEFFSEVWSQIKDTPKIEEHVYSDAGHAWDCFPYLPKWFFEERPNKGASIIEKLKGVCADKFDGPKREVTNDALKRTIIFFMTHAK